MTLSIPNFKKDDYVYNSTPVQKDGETISQISYASIKYNDRRKVSEIAYVDKLDRYEISDNFRLSTPFYHVRELYYIDPSGNNVSKENLSKWRGYRSYKGRITGITTNETGNKYIITFNNCNNLEFIVDPTEKLFSLSNTTRIASANITC